MFELSLSKPLTKEASPATARQARHTTEKHSLLFSFCARRISFSPNEKSIFLWCFALTSKAAGLASIFCKGMAEFPPHPPSAIPLLGRTEILAATLFIQTFQRDMRIVIFNSHGCKLNRFLKTFSCLLIITLYRIERS